MVEVEVYQLKLNCKSHQYNSRRYRKRMKANGKRKALVQDARKSP